MVDINIPLEDQWLTLSEAGKTLGIDVRTLEKLIDVHKVPVIHLDRGFRVTLRDLNSIKKPLRGFAKEEIPYTLPSLAVLTATAKGPGKVITFIGGDNLTAPVAILFASTLAQTAPNSKICLIDLNVTYGGTVVTITGLGGEKTLNELNEQDLKEAALRELGQNVPALGITIYPTSNHQIDAPLFSPNYVKKLLSVAKEMYDYVVITGSKLLFDEVANEVLVPKSDAVVYCCDVIVSDIFRMTAWLNHQSELESLNKSCSNANIGVVATNSFPGNGLAAQDLQRAAGEYPVWSVIPNNFPLVVRAMNTQAMEDVLKDEKMAAAYRGLVQTLIAT